VADHERQRGVLGALMIVAAGVLSACASGSAGSSHHPTSTVATRPATALNGCTRGPAYGSAMTFELSIAPGVEGSSTSKQAAVTFAKHGGVPGYGTDSTKWTTERDARGVTVREATTFLHVVRLPTGGWVVDSGGRCG